MPFYQLAKILRIYQTIKKWMWKMENVENLLVVWKNNRPTATRQSPFSTLKVKPSNERCPTPSVHWGKWQSYMPSLSAYPTFRAGRIPFRPPHRDSSTPTDAPAATPFPATCRIPYHPAAKPYIEPISGIRTIVAGNIKMMLCTGRKQGEDRQHSRYTSDSSLIPDRYI